MSQSKIKSDGWLLSYNKKNVVPSEHLLENSEIWIFANSTSDSVTTLKADGETFLVKRMADTTSQSKIKSYGWLLSYNKKRMSCRQKTSSKIVNFEFCKFDLRPCNNFKSRSRDFSCKTHGRHNKPIENKIKLMVVDLQQKECRAVRKPRQKSWTLNFSGWCFQQETLETISLMRWAWNKRKRVSNKKYHVKNILDAAADNDVNNKPIIERVANHIHQIRLHQSSYMGKTY